MTGQQVEVDRFSFTWLRLQVEAGEKKEGQRLEEAAMRGDGHENQQYYSWET